ncbi:membrane protein [Streptomyces capillispiralis]|uniref:Putative repeat protein (TIGR03943 family) n=1 Tax=Streptomyces capillispiralis TaxID=68182 RepID=A0A561TGG3_9ACTN|nr:putative repeat protein (TIGR03943 family) [Streptomyces capillispiralis]GHH91131.1 membrane protein [Streptomyces capillispiralis]
MRPTRRPDPGAHPGRVPGVRLNRQAQAALLFLLGAAVLHAGLTDLHLRYVKAGLRPLLLLSGAVLVATAAATLRYEWRGRREEDAEPHREPRISWLLTLPLFALILVAPPALGSYSATHTGTALQKPFGFPDLPARGPLRLGVEEYAARAVYDDGRHLSGRPISITGFVALDRADAPHLVRMTLNCCAADAQPVKIALTGAIPPVLRPDTWLEVTGTYTPRRTRDPVNDGPVPYFDVTAAEPVPPPSDPYG